MRLRKIVGGAHIVRADRGYRMVDSELDAQRFEHLIRAGRDRAHTIEQRIASYEDGLALWSGAAFDGFEDFEWVVAEGRRLDELHEQAIDEHFDLRLDLGHHEAVVADLREAHLRDPTRESRTRLLALALYRSGRQADSLAVIATTRRELRDRLGLSVGSALEGLELQILRHDHHLATSPIDLRSMSAAEVESRIRSSVTLIRAGAFEEAAAVIDEAQQIANGAADRRSSAFVLLARARLVTFDGSGDPFPLIDEARQVGRFLRDGPLLAQAALVRAGAGVPADRTEALVELIEPIELLPPTAPEIIDLLCFAAFVVAILDASDAAERLVEEARRANARDKSERSFVLVQVAQSLVGAICHSHDEHTCAIASEAFGLACRLEDPRLIVAASLATIRVRYQAGDLVGVDEILDPLEAAANQALLPFGVIRVHLCRTTNAIARGELDRVPTLIAEARTVGSSLHTFVAEEVTQAQELLLAQEAQRLGEFAPLVRWMLDNGAAPAWNATLAVCGDVDATRTLSQIAPTIPRDSHFSTFVALSCQVAAERRDATLGRWCVQQLRHNPTATLMTGLGSIVFGFAAHFDGLAHVAVDELAEARERFERAVALADQAQARLWHAHSTIELADVLIQHDGHKCRTQARTLLEGLLNSDIAEQSKRIRNRAITCLTKA